MNREVHVRICGGLKVKLLWSTRHLADTFLRNGWRASPGTGGYLPPEQLDTFTGMRRHKADILIPNMGDAWKNKFGGPLTFSIETLQPVIDSVEPEIILPVHFASFAHFHETSSTLKSWNNEKVKIFTEGDCFQM